MPDFPTSQAQCCLTFCFAEGRSSVASTSNRSTTNKSAGTSIRSGATSPPATVMSPPRQVWVEPPAVRKRRRVTEDVDAHDEVDAENASRGAASSSKDAPVRKRRKVIARGNAPPAVWTPAQDKEVIDVSDSPSVMQLDEDSDQPLPKTSGRRRAPVKSNVIYTPSDTGPSVVPDSQPSQPFTSSKPKATSSSAPRPSKMGPIPSISPKIFRQQIDANREPFSQIESFPSPIKSPKKKSLAAGVQWPEKKTEQRKKTSLEDVLAQKDKGEIEPSLFAPSPKKASKRAQSPRSSPQRRENSQAQNTGGADVENATWTVRGFFASLFRPVLMTVDTQ